LLVSGCKGK